MRLTFWIALFFAVGTFAYAQTPTQGYRYCTTTTSGSISHEMCSFAPLIVQVQAPAVTVQPAPVTVLPAPAVVAPPPPKPKPEKPIKE